MKHPTLTNPMLHAVLDALSLRIETKFEDSSALHLSVSEYEKAHAWAKDELERREKMSRERQEARAHGLTVRQFRKQTRIRFHTGG